MQWKRVFKGKGLYIAVFLQVFAYFYPHQATRFWEFLVDYFRSADFLYFYLMPREGGLITLLLPFVAALPAALFTAEDIETGYLRLVLQRSGKTRYALFRIFEALSGAIIASLAGSLIYVGFIAVMSPMDQNILTSWRNVLANSSFANLAAALHGIPMVIDSLLRFAFAAAAWALFGVTFSALSANRGLALVLTFSLHFSLAYTFETTTALFAWSPAVIQVPSISYRGSLLYVAFQQFVYFAAALVASLMGLRYRLNKI